MVADAGAGGLALGLGGARSMNEHMAVRAACSLAEVRVTLTANADDEARVAKAMRQVLGPP